MFLSLIKKLSLKKIVKNKLTGLNAPLEGQIKQIGLLIDGVNFSKTEQLIKEFTQYGISQNQIKALVYTKNKAFENTENIIYFRPNNITVSGNIVDETIKKFADYPFDLLVNYYDTEQINLDYINVKSKASFKAGFMLNEQRLNHFMIDVPISEYRLFTEELFKYLKVLNKI